jgi:glycosyltransferase involved in cell wall biosynthesis
VVTGHGIDTNLFAPAASRQSANTVLKILTVGRIAPTKRQDILLLATKQLVNRQIPVAVKIVGGLGLSKHLSYAAALQKLVKQEQLGSLVEFVGPTAHAETVDYYQQADIFVNLSGTGSLDKAVLEAMSCGCLVLTANEAFAKILPPELFLPVVDVNLLADRLAILAAWPANQRRVVGQELRQLVVKQHNLEQLLIKILEEISVLL